MIKEISRFESLHPVFYSDFSLDIHHLDQLDRVASDPDLPAHPGIST
jgi:hypothetical protein